MRFQICWFTVALIGLACVPTDAEDPDETATTTTDDTTSTSDEPSSDDTSTSEGGDSSSDGVDETGPMLPACGNGMLEEGEVCDDGNEEDLDGCSSDCLVSSEGEWTWLEDAEGSVNAVVTDASGVTMGVGTLGSVIGGESALVRRLSVDGMLELTSDPAPEGNSIFWDIHPGPDASLIATGSSGSNGWVHTLIDDEGQDVVLDDFPPFRHSHVGPTGFVASTQQNISSASFLFRQDYDGTTTYVPYMPDTIADVVYEDAGTILSVTGTTIGTDENLLTRFDAEFNVLQTVSLDTNFVTTTFRLAPTPDGGVLLLGTQSPGVTRHMQRYDADLVMQWEVIDSTYTWNDVLMIGDQIIAAGTLVGVGADPTAPLVGILDGSGRQIWTSSLSPNEFGYEDGDFFGISYDPSGALVAGGTMIPPEVEFLENGRPFMARFDPFAG